ncbi:MAG: hypothetical protein AAF570_26470, partial [Bacteroidota bacterium]
RVAYLNHCLYRKKMARITDPLPDGLEAAVKKHRIVEAFAIVERLLLETAVDPADWKRLCAILFDEAFPGSSSDGRELYGLSLQIGTRHYNRNHRDPEMAATLLDIYLHGWDSGALLTYAAINPQHYKNACNFAIRTGKIEVAKALTEKWRDQLDARAVEEGLVHFNRAFIAYAKEDLQTAWEEIQEFRPKDLRRLGQKVLEIKILAEKDPVLAVSKIDTFIKWLAKPELAFAEKQMRDEKGRMQLARRILNLAPNDKTTASRLEQDIEASQFDREWLRKLLRIQLNLG